MIALHEKLIIARLGQKGEGIAAGPVFVPYALPGDTIIAEVDGDRGRIGEIVTPSPDRIAAFCPAFTVCGGCAVQTWAARPYAEWKRGLVADALRHAGVTAIAGKMVDAHGAGRRRATFHARSLHEASGRLRVEVGFMAARSHDIVAIDSCPVLAPEMGGALAAARAVAQVLAHLEKPLDIVVTSTLEGLDVDIRGCGVLDFPLTQKLIAVAMSRDLPRISNHGAVLIERRPPLLAMGCARLVFPPGAFLQATLAGEDVLAALAQAGIGKARRVADLFSGVGTFALRLAEVAEVHAVECEAPMSLACFKAFSHAQGLKKLTGETRDLFRRPLSLEDLARFDAVVLDPPRAGAMAQMQVLAKSHVARVVSVSCNVQSFARDARILVDGGYALESVTPVDQFRHSAHVEIVGVFSRKAEKAKKRGLLS